MSGSEVENFGEEGWERETVESLPKLMRRRTCPAGEPWTGDTPEDWHGHTDCWLYHLGATEIERLRAEIDHLQRILMQGVSVGLAILAELGYELEQICQLDALAEFVGTASDATRDR